jgi:M61 glycyl aminopeptidase
MKSKVVKSCLNGAMPMLLVIVLWSGPSVTEALAAVHDYTIRVDASLTSVQVEARLAEPGLLLSTTRGGTSRLRDVAGCAGESVPRGWRGSLRVSGSCLRYTASIEPTNSSDRFRPQWPQVGHEHWLWLPALTEQDVVRISLVLPAGVQAFVPWRRVDGAPVDGGHYELRASPGSGDALAWFGRLDQGSLKVAGASLPLVVLGPGLVNERMTRWLTEAAGLVAGVGGRFPNTHALVVVEPGQASLFGDSVVPFGHVIRSGEEVVRFFVKPEASLDELRADWTAVHEFAHLLLPYVQDDQKWISEGFASYYQNVLLARAGIYTEQEAWRRLARSFAAGGETRNPPSPNGASDRSFWDVRMLIYWSGAALALMTDVELRQQTDGQQSLDSVLGQLADCCLPSSRAWEGRELFAKLDALSRTGVFTRHYDSYADSAGMPPYENTLEVLGVRVKGGTVVFDETAPLAGIRRQLFAPRQPVLQKERSPDRDLDEPDYRDQEIAPAT